MNDYARAPNQPLLTTSSPTFAGLTINGTATFASTVTATGLLTLNPGQNKRFLSVDGASTGSGANFGMANTISDNGNGTYNDVVRWGWNVGDGGSNNGRLDITKHAFYYAIERSWLTGGAYYTESHQYHILADGTSYRPDSSFYPVDGSSSDAQRAFNVDQVIVGTWAVSPTTKFTFDAKNNKIDTTTGCIVGIGGAAQVGQALKVFGSTTITGALVLGSYVQCAAGTTINLGTGQGYMEFQAGGVRMTNQGTVTNVPLSVKGMASQSGNLQEWMSSAGTVLAHVGPTGYFGGIEITAPAAPAANGYRIYAEDNGAGKTRLMCVFGSGAPQQIAIEP